MKMEVSRIFWSEWFWLPPNVTWEHLKNTDNGLYKAQISDLIITIPLAFFLLFLRVLFERFIAAPVGRWFGLSGSRIRRTASNPYLEKIYKKNRIPDAAAYSNMSKQTDMSVRQIERWFRLRRMQDRPSKLSRFTQASWRGVFYFAIFAFGMASLWHKSWLWHTEECWRGYPDHYVPREIFWYYALEVGFYISLLITQFTDRKRSDFYAHLVHHLSTLGLMGMSWTMNQSRIGSLILVLHDVCDPWLESAKVFKYIKWQKWADFCFLTFFILWGVTRMILLPYKILYTVLYELPVIQGYWPQYYFNTGLLLLLQVLNIFWFYLISRAFYNAVIKGGVSDDRSSSDEDSDEVNENHISNQRTCRS